jgi:hypothetical protein
VEGIVVRVKSIPSLVLSISLLQRSVLLEIDPGAVAPHRMIESPRLRPATLLYATS